MGKLLDCISSKEEEFIRQQKVFFVATAPLSADCHINVSPKSPGTSVVVIDPHTVAYCDLTGSGAEAAAHVLENQRMTLMFCNIETGPPKILRLHGKATVVVKEEISDELCQRFPTVITSSIGFRCVYILKVDRVSSSCGYSLPVMKFEKYRQTLNEYTEKAGQDGMDAMCLKKNSYSIDGLPSLGLLRNSGKRIEQDRQEGYYYGKEVKEETPHNRPEKNWTVPTPKTMDQRYNISYLAAAALLGAVVSWAYFHCKYTLS